MDLDKIEEILGLKIKIHKTKKKQDIEFNDGFVTALALFYNHRSDNSVYAGSDHLYDLEIPRFLSESLKIKIQRFKDKVLDNRYSELTSEELHEIFEECLEILKEVDFEVFGCDVTVNYE